MSLRTYTRTIMANIITVKAFDRPFAQPFNAGISRSVGVGVGQINRVDAYSDSTQPAVHAVINSGSGAIYTNETVADITTAANAPLA